MLDVHLLGPVEVSSGGHRIALNGAKPTAILAALVVHLGEVLSAERLVDLTWEEEPPATARALVASHVSGLRRALAGTAGGDAIRTRSPGYVAEFPPSAVDARRFEDAFAAGRKAAVDGRAEEAVDILQAASRLWRGRDALEGLGQSFARVEAIRLTELRLEAQEFRFSAELDLDRRTDLVSELVAHVAAHPLRERPRGQLMTALFRAGRMPDALRCYDEGRRLLRTEIWAWTPARNCAPCTRPCSGLTRRCWEHRLPAQPRPRRRDPYPRRRRLPHAPMRTHRHTTWRVAVPSGPTAVRVVRFPPNSPPTWPTS
jgi:DNA-binding SARP family transcriptional activator